MKYDVCVIGSGPGGYVAAIKSAQLGLKTVCVDKDKIGGVCLNTGCIPSKALIAAAHLYDKIGHAGDIGITASKVELDTAKLQTWKQSVVNKLTGGIGLLFKANGVDYVQGNAQFKSTTEILVGKESIQAKYFIVAVGSRPIEIPGFAFDKSNVLSSTEGLEMSNLPKKLLVIGGGYIGLEIGSLYSKFGVEVTICEAAGSLLAGVADPDCVNVVARKLKKSGVKVLLNAKAQSYKKDGGKLQVTVSVDGKNEIIEADKILVTVGRKTNADQINLAQVGVKVDAKGFVTVDKQMRTNVPNIFAIGDVAGQPMLAHKASREALIAAEVISGKNSVMDVKTIPAVIFTDPEIASAGMTVAEAQAKGHEVSVGQFPYAANGRSLSVMESEGFIKIISDKKTGLVLGVHIVGYEASNLISEAALAIEMTATAEDIAGTIHPHPTLGEMMMEAAESAMGHAIHIAPKQSISRSSNGISKSP